jgi:hypothetical protein
MVAFGGLALLGAAVAAGQAWRRRRIQLATTTPDTGGADGGA